MTARLRIFRVCLRVLLTLLLAAGLLVGGIAVFLYHNPQALARHLAEEVEARTGMACTLDSVSVALLPLPSLAVSDVHVHADGMDFRVAYATVRPALAPLLRGIFEPGSITLLRPQLHIAAAPPDAGKPPFRLAGAALPAMLDGTELRILYGTLRVDGDTPLLLEDISTDMRLRAPASVRLDVAGNVRLGDGLTPFAVRGEARGDGAGGIAFPRLALALDADRLVFQGSLRLDGAAGPALDGTLELERLSLSQWFGFARQLPPGLQHALNALRGRLEFHLDMRGLDVPHIEVAVGETRFAGRGEVPRWTTPVVLLDLRAPSLDLDAVFPETRGRNPAPPAFGHAPLTPEPGSPAARALPGPDIGYDINLHVTSVQSWKLELGEVGFRCAPGAQDQVLMTFDVGNMYGGKGEGSLALRRQEQKTVYAVRASLKNIPVEQVVAPWIGPVLGGRLWLETEATTQGHTVAAFLTGLDGRLALRLENGFLRTGGAPSEKVPFSRLRLESKTRSSGDAAAVAAGRIPAELAFAGQWKGTLDAPQIKGTFQLEGPVIFSSTGFFPIQVRKAPGHVAVTAEKTLTGLAEALRADVTGRFSVHSGKRWLAVEDGQGEIAGMALRGAAQATWPDARGRGAEARGHLALSVGDARRALRVFVPALAETFPQGTLQNVQGQADVQWSEGSLDLARLRVRVDDTTVSGALSGQWQGRAHWQGDLSADALHLDRYLSGKDSGGKSPGGKNANGKAGAGAPPVRKSAVPWSLNWLKTYDLGGTLHIGSLRVHNVSARDVRIPVQMKAGTLVCDAVRGTVYGAPARGSFRAEAGKGLVMRLALEADGLDMQALCADRGMKTVLGGRGNVWLRAQGAPHSSAQIPGAFDGAWRIQVTDAFLQSRNAKGALTGKRTLLGTAQGNGVLQKGVLRSETLTLAGPDIKAAGGGWADLNTDTLDVRLQVNMYRIPEFPVRFYGSLSAPQRSINAGKAIVDTLGNLGTGVLDAVGDVLGGALRLF